MKQQPDSQTSVEVHVLQGERDFARDNRTLGRFHLVGIPPAPRGVPQIEVAFDIDANGIVNVSAKDLGTGTEQKITITASSGLAEEDIKKMVHDAEANASEDKKRREAIEDRNRLDTLVYSTEKTLGEHKDKLGAAELGTLETALEDAKKALEGDDHATIKAAMERLTQSSHKLAEAMYKQAASGGEPAAGSRANDAGASAGAQASEEGVIDAEYVDVDKK